MTDRATVGELAHYLHVAAVVGVIILAQTILLIKIASVLIQTGLLLDVFKVKA